MSLIAVGITRLVPNGKTGGWLVTDLLETAEDPMSSATKLYNESKKGEKK